MFFDGLWKHDYQVRGKVLLDGTLFYEGDLRYGAPYGYGTYFDDDGQVTYRGQLRNFKETGVGILYYEDGYRYIGEMYFGMADGQGVLKDANGKIVHEGYFSDGEIVIDPEEIANDPNTTIKKLLRNADHFVIDGIYENDMGLNSQQAAMVIKLDNDEHVAIFNELSDAEKIKLINSYTQLYWGDVIGVDECFTFVTHNNVAYAQATIRYLIDDADVEITLYPDGEPMDYE